jgi:hypothetical protein
MYYKKTLFLTLLLSSTLLAFQDHDIDGIEDSLDRCPNTPFEAFVDKNGCAVNINKKASNSNYWGALTLKVGSTIQRDDEYEDDEYVDLFANYRYHNMDISISNSRSTTENSITDDNSNSDNDIYISAGYNLLLSDARLKLSAGTKIVDDSNSRDDDYFMGLNYDYFVNSKQNIFLYGGYTFSGDDELIDYDDYSSFSIGTGYTLTPAFYSAISYSYTGSNYPDGDAEEGVTWYNSYSLNKNIFLTAAYTYGIDDYSYDNTFRLGLGLYLQ